MRRLMMLAALGAAGIVLPVGNQAASQNVTFCLLVNRTGESGLRGMSDTQIRNGMCMTTRETAQAIASGSAVANKACQSATVTMYREFIRRFPNEDPKSTIGRC